MAVRGTASRGRRGPPPGPKAPTWKHGGSRRSGRAGDPAGAPGRASGSLADDPHRQRLPSCPPLGPTDRQRDLYGSIIRTFGISPGNSHYSDARLCFAAGTRSLRRFPPTICRAQRPPGRSSHREIRIRWAMPPCTILPHTMTDQVLAPDRALLQSPTLWVVAGTIGDSAPAGINRRDGPLRTAMVYVTVPIGRHREKATVHRLAHADQQAASRDAIRPTLKSIGRGESRYAADT